MEKDFWENILKKIKAEHIKPTSKLVFFLKHFFSWFFFLFSLVIWSISVSIILAYLLEADWSLYHKLWLIKLTLVYLPFFWFVFLCLFSLIAFFTFKNTKKWYKFSLFKIFIFDFLLSIFLWIIFYFSWISQTFEEVLQNNLPEYRSIFVEDQYDRMKEIWQNEDAWYLLWNITSIEDNSVDIVDSLGKNRILYVWDYTIIKNRVDLKVWEKIKIIWEKISQNEFKALEIRPIWWNKFWKRN